MPLNATIGQVLRPIVAISLTCAGFLQVFSSSTCTKRSQVDNKATVFNRGITYQTKEEGLIKVSINLLGGHSNKNNIWSSGFAIAFVIVCVLNHVFETFYRSPEKTLKRVTN